MQALMRYELPGNIRELRNLIERACILSTGEEIGAETFPVTAPNDASIRLHTAPWIVTADDVARLMPGPSTFVCSWRT